MARAGFLFEILLEFVCRSAQEDAGVVSEHIGGVRGTCSGSQVTRVDRAFGLVWLSWVSCAGSEPCVEAALCQLPLSRAEDAMHRVLLACASPPPLLCARSAVTTGCEATCHRRARCSCAQGSRSLPEVGAGGRAPA